MSPRSGLAQTFGPEHGVEIYVVFASESVTAVTYPRNWHHGRQHMSSTKHATLLERVSCMDLWRKMLLHSEAKALIPVARNEPPSHFYEYRDWNDLRSHRKNNEPGNRNIVQPPNNDAPNEPEESIARREKSVSGWAARLRHHGGARSRNDVLTGSRAPA